MRGGRVRVLTLSDEYSAALGSFIAEQSEAGLSRAYDVGRMAMEREVSLLELTAIHRDATERWMRVASNVTEAAKIARVGSVFFVEALAPMEMALRSYQEANDTLRILNQHLEDEVSARSRQVLETLEELRRADAARRELIRHLNVAQEEERRLFANALHDDTVQVLTAAILRLGSMSLHVEDPGLASSLNQIEELLGGAVSRCRNLLFALRPVTLDEQGLVAAIEEILHRLEEDAIPYTFEHDLPDEPDPDVRIVAFRVLDEAVRNAEKHSGATHVLVRLVVRGSGIEIACTDNGRGFDLATAEPRPGHLGLETMRERVELAGGTFAVSSVPGSGTTVEAWLPIAT
jgi:signal transduction histidine kinase